MSKKIVDVEREVPKSVACLAVFLPRAKYNAGGTGTEISGFDK